MSRGFELRILDIDNLEPGDEYILFPSDRNCIFSADSSCSIVLMDRKSLWAGEGAKPAQPRRNPVGKMCIRDRVYVGEQSVQPYYL